MGKTLELPDALYDTIEHEARQNNMKPVEFLAQAIELRRSVTTLDLLRLHGQTVSRPRQGPCMTEPFPLLQTSDGSLVSDLVIKERR